MERDSSPIVYGLRSVLDRMAWSLLVFSGSLVIVLSLSWVFLIPSLTSIPLEGRAMAPEEVRTAVYGLRSRIREGLERRDELMSPIQDPLYKELRVQKRQIFSIVRVYDGVRDLASRVSRGQENAVYLRSLRFEEGKNILMLEGEIRHVGPRSMTVLAQFTEGLLDLPSVSSVERPVFRREQDGEGSFFSPFTLVLHLFDVPADLHTSIPLIIS